ncbi:MAG TPA: MFS transporter [Jatrophihabitantaceae bacterium]|jgi:EmrB/QacA subfamily drug resistance transporter
MSTHDAMTAGSPFAPPAASARRRWAALIVLAVAQFMVFLDETVVNVALPSLKADLGFTQPTLAWVINAYMLAFGGLLLLGGRIADLYGRRRIFLAGTAMFGLASLLDGLAMSPEQLVAARALQGVGAALATPAALALITSLFPPGPERVRALSIWGALSGLGFAVGILLGGIITDLASWRWVFLINVPIAIASLEIVPRFIAESRSTTRPRFDVPGAITLTAGMSALVYAFLNAASVGWGAVQTHVLLAVALTLLAAFGVIESRGTAPLIPLGIMRNRRTLVPNVVQFLLGGSLISSFFLLTLYLQQVLGYTPLQAGISYLPLAAGVATATALANRWVPTQGPRRLAAVGLTLAAAGLVVVAHAPANGSYLLNVLPALVLLGFGAGLSFVSITNAALATVDEAVAGLASALLSAAVMLGGALGLAVLATVATARRNSLLDTRATPLAAQVGGLNLAFAVAAVGALIAALIAAMALDRNRAEDNADPKGNDEASTSGQDQPAPRGR